VPLGKLQTASDLRFAAEPECIVMSLGVPWFKMILSPFKATLPAFGGVGIFPAAFVDSSFLPLPLVTDLLLMDLSSRHPLRMPYYAAMATLGSLGGCIWIYWIARKGGQTYYERSHSHPPGRIRRMIRDYPTASVFLPAVAPFPVPFKPFVIAQGVFQVPFITFVVWTLVGRGALFFIEAFLGARYGMAAKQFLRTQKWASVAIAAALIVIFFAVRRLSALSSKASSQVG
jgi:membrane protein YqaA with SNARE-associated domain